MWGQNVDRQTPAPLDLGLCLGPDGGDAEQHVDQAGHDASQRRREVEHLPRRYHRAEMGVDRVEIAHVDVAHREERERPLTRPTPLGGQCRHGWVMLTDCKEQYRIQKRADGSWQLPR